MKSIKFAAALAALALLAGCQAGGTGVSTYGGELQGLGEARSSDGTVRKKVGKVRRVKANGDVYYVNKYVRVKKKSAVKNAYAPKRTTKSAKAIAKVLKKTKVTKRKTKGRSKGGPKNLNALIAKHAKANGVPYKLAPRGGHRRE